MKRILFISFNMVLIPLCGSPQHYDRSSNGEREEVQKNRVWIENLKKGINSEEDMINRISVSEENPFYWQYKDTPVMLLGGSWQDNLFNHPMGLEAHLDKLSSVGGNYVRNTMSHRNVGNVFAYERNQNGLFNLDRFNEEYWRRFRNFLELCYRRDIIVQIEIWEPHDLCGDHQSFGGWSHNPFNPQNNINYTLEETGMPETVNYRPGEEPSDHPIFRTVPELNHNKLVLKYQQAYVDKVLSIAFQYPNTLFCISNESGEVMEWSNYWADYAHAAAKAAGIKAHVTEMRRKPDIRSIDHQTVFDFPERYTFLDISQNNGHYGLKQKHYDNIMYVREYISGNQRPVNNVKNYGSNRHGENESIARFCRMVFAGCASARFHRPHPYENPAAHEASSEWGLGLSFQAQQVIQSMRWVIDQIEFAATRPANDLLLDREENEAYLLAQPEEQYAIYFPKGGEVTLGLTSMGKSWEIRWRNVLDGQVREVERIEGGASVSIKTPGRGHWVAVILPKE